VADSVFFHRKYRKGKMETLHFYIATKYAWDAHHSGGPHVERRQKPRAHPPLGQRDAYGLLETEEVRGRREAFHRGDARNFAAIGESDFFDLEDGRIVTVIRFRGTEGHKSFSSFPGVIPFPDLMTNTPIGEQLAAELGQFGILATDTTFEAATKISKHHPAFKPRTI
jgi:hypothetical protein